jgi:hypothetical protein
MNVGINETNAEYLKSSGKIGRFKLICSNTKVLGPDVIFLFLTLSFILTPSLWFMSSQILLYENIYLIVAMEAIFLLSTMFNMYTLIDVSTTDPGIIPRNSLRINSNYKYFIDPPQAG